MSDEPKPMYTIEFRPIERPTMDLMLQIFDLEGRDPVKAYSRALTLAVMAGAMLHLDPAVVAAHMQQFSILGAKVIKDHPEIYGSMPLQ